MKKTILMMVTAVIVIFTSACKENTKSDDKTNNSTTTVEEHTTEKPASIIGEWKMTDFNIDMEVPKGQEKAIEAMKKQMIESTSYTFKEDGTLSYKNQLVKEATGTYTYADGKITYKDNKTKKQEVLTVDELKADKLVFTVEEAGRKATMSFTR